MPRNNYEQFRQAPFNRPEYYPIRQALPADLYRPVAPWMGRLILPPREQREQVKGVLLELYHTPPEHQQLVGQTVYLRWLETVNLEAHYWALARDVYFSEVAEANANAGGVHPTRLNGWTKVNPLESLAGVRPHDDLIVKLPDPVAVGRVGDMPVISIQHDPIQITGRYYALVQFITPLDEQHTCYLVAHYNRASQHFDGPREGIYMPIVVPNLEDVAPFTNTGIEHSPLNETGWYIYGTQDRAGRFIVQALGPRRLFQLHPDRIITGQRAAHHYIRRESWADAPTQKGHISSVMLSTQGQTLSDWREGDHALIAHVYGGIGGNKKEQLAVAGVFFGHFSYGVATVRREPLADELQFDIIYHQIYVHNINGHVSGTMAWSRYMGDRQWGWMGTRPTCDVLLKLDTFTSDYHFNGRAVSALRVFQQMLEGMTARYRVGDGTGGTYVGPANNCSQDSNQALYATLKMVTAAIRANPYLEQWLQHNPHEAERFKALLMLARRLKRRMFLFGARGDWHYSGETLGLSVAGSPVRSLLTGLSSWPTLLPRVASNTIASVFIKHGAAGWVLRTNQLGGTDPDILPVAPLAF